MSAIRDAVKAGLERMFAGGPAFPPSSVPQALGIAESAAATYAVAEALMAADLALLTAELAAQVAVSGQPNDPLPLQDGVEAMTAEVSLGAEVSTTVETAISAVASLF